MLRQDKQNTQVAISEAQFITWANQGAAVTAKKTADSVRTALSLYKWPVGADYDVYLQGSYRNSTNIYGDSDVDVIIQLNSSFQSNLSEDAIRRFNFVGATYKWNDFKPDVLRALQDYYGYENVKEGNKSIKIVGNNNRLSADVVPCFQHRQYNDSLIQYLEGIAFYVPNEDRWIINYPKIHYENGVSKNKRASGLYKPTVRIFKNIRSYLAERGFIVHDVAPSYFVECLLYNVPDYIFAGSHRGVVASIIAWLQQVEPNSLVCQNGQSYLFGTPSEQWNLEDARKYADTLIEVCKS